MRGKDAGDGMSGNPGQTDSEYCERLAAIVFPAQVWIDGDAYRPEELLAALRGTLENGGEKGEDPCLQQRVAVKYLHGSVENYIALLVKLIFAPAEGGAQRERVEVLRREGQSQAFTPLALDTQLRVSAELVRDAAVQAFYGRDPEMYFEGLIEAAFPRVVTIEEVGYTASALQSALQGNWELQRKIAQKYHYASEELYFEWMLDRIFASARKRNASWMAMAWEFLKRRIFRRGKAEPSGESGERATEAEKVQTGWKSRSTKDELRSALRADLNYQERVRTRFERTPRRNGHRLKHGLELTRSRWLLELYCDRLVELAIPERVEIEGKTYSESELRAAFERYPGFRERVRRTFGVAAADLKKNPARDVAAVEAGIIAEAFPDEVHIAGTCFTSVPMEVIVDQYLTGKRKDAVFVTRPVEDLRRELPDDPKLQQAVAAKTYLVPSKWLLEYEMQARGVWNGDSAAGDIYRIAAEKASVGVCFSGGGIRSATFNLGVTQGLAQLGLLPRIDYLSSVSGGGYIHEFLAGWILRNKRQSEVIAELIPQAEPGCLPRSPEPIQWLKRYASYLTPARGAFSTDTWTAFAIWLRNTILNQVPILATFACCFFLVHLLVPEPTQGWEGFFEDRPVDTGRAWLLSGMICILYATVSVLRLGFNLHWQEKRRSTGTGGVENLLSNEEVVWWIILPWLGSSVWMSYWVQMVDVTESYCWVPLGIACALMLILTLLVAFAGGAMRAHMLRNPNANWWGKSWTRIGFVVAGLTATAFAAGVGWAGIKLTRSGADWASDWLHRQLGAKEAVNQSLSYVVHQVSRGVTASVSGSVGYAEEGAPGMWIDPWRVRLAILPGILMSLPYIAIETMLGLLGRDYWGMRREWLARLRAWSLLYAMLWTGVIALVFLGPYLGDYVFDSKSGSGIKWTTAIAFLLSHAATIFAGWSGKADGKATDKGILGLKPFDFLALVASPVAIATLLLLLSYGASQGVDRLTYWLAQCPRPWISNWQPYMVADGACLALSAVVALLLGWRVDINEFSMHEFFKNRVSRCYLGATVPGRREPDPFTGFDERNKVQAHELDASGAWVLQEREHPPRLRDLLPIGYYRPTGYKDRRVGTYDGPFPIFCSTLNLTTGKDLATQERKGTSFAFTPLRSGYSLSWTDGMPYDGVSYNGYVPTDEYAYRNGGIHLDSAVAISGAALNPNQGYNSNPALAFLMTFFNVRLGWWITNPRKTEVWPASYGRSTPKFALVHLFKELFGMVGDGTKFVNLSDGGHFENMGLYELVRRRCRFIVVCDAEADPEMKFEGMGSALTKCRADFGAEIDLDLRPLQKQADTGYSKAHCVVGTVRYPPPRGAGSPAAAETACECLGDQGDDEYTGVIVYLKSSLVGDEPADLLTHQLKYAVFPQDSTANQWFTETLFEAYRRLGHHIALSAIQPAISPEKTQVCERKEIPKLFDRMYAIWYPRTPEMDKYLGAHLKQYEDILKELREHKELVGLEAGLNDKRSWADARQVTWNVPEECDAQSKLYPRQFANSLLDFMYTVYTDLQLAFPDNRVSPHAEWWICLFRRWCRVSLVRDAWNDYAPMYSVEFRLFARRELKLPPVAGYVE